MTLSASHTQTPQAATRITHMLMRAHRIAYAQLNAELLMVDASDNLGELLLAEPLTWQGCVVGEVFHEFVGAEESLRAILRGELPSYVLTQVNREPDDETIVYLDFQVVPLDKTQPDAGLLVIVEDTTTTNRLVQSLIQSRNALRLTQNDLARANETLTQLSRFKSFMLTMAAHDLRSPLTAITGYAELLMEEGDGVSLDKKRTFAGAIKLQAQHIDQMISDLIDFDQIEQGRLTLELMPCNLNELALLALRPLKALADLRRQTIRLILSPAPIFIQAEPRRFYQIVQNLIGNAIKYSPEGGAIEIATQIESGDGLVSITDTGPGLTADEQAHVFQPYYRIESAHYSHTTGKGLGLYIAKLLIDEHNGRIEVASQLGQGTTFTVRLPLCAS
jgi:signal transduction histidine kinase